MAETPENRKIPCAKLIDLWICVFLTSIMAFLLLLILVHWTMSFMVLFCYFVYCFRCFRKQYIVAGLFFQKEKGQDYISRLRAKTYQPSIVLKGEAYHYIGEKSQEDYEKEITFAYSKTIPFEYFYDSTPDLAENAQVMESKNVSLS